MIILWYIRFMFADTQDWLSSFLARRCRYDPSTSYSDTLAAVAWITLIFFAPFVVGFHI